MDKVPEVLDGAKALLEGVTGSGRVLVDQRQSPTPEDAAQLMGAQPLGWLVTCESVEETEMLAESENYDMALALWHFRQLASGTSHAAVLEHVRDVWQAIKAAPTLGVAQCRVLRRRVEGLDSVPEFRNQLALHMPVIRLVVNFDSNC